MIFSEKVGFFKNMFPPSDWLPRPLGCKFIMFLTFSEISRMPFFRTCDILEFEVVGSRHTFLKLGLLEKSFQKEKFDYFKV